MNAALSKPTLSSGIGELAEMFRGPRARPVAMNVHGRQFVVDKLTLLQQLAINLETELETFRRLEFDRQRRGMLEDEASVVLSAAPQQDGNVFRPDFGRKP